MPRRSRSERLAKVRGRRKRTVITTTSVAAGLAALAVIFTLHPGILGKGGGCEPSVELPQDVSAEASRAPEPGKGIKVPVEVPSLLGMPLEEAMLLIEAADLVATRVPTPAGDAKPGTVLDQSPAAGTRVSPGSTVEVTFADPQALSATRTPSARGPVVCLDPGHQAKPNRDKEAVGPGSSEMKAKASAGAVGVSTGTPEHELALAIAKRVKERLEAYGVVVVMTRKTANVDISNAQRAQVANDAGADLFVRIHAGSDTNADHQGVRTLYPAGNEWARPIEQESLRAASLIHREAIASTGARDRSLVGSPDMAGFNWSKVPAVQMEAGCLSNPAEDKKLADSEYQDKVADGIARGVLRYLGMSG